MPEALTETQRALMNAIELDDVQRVVALVAQLGDALDFVDPIGTLSPLQLAIDVGGDGFVQRGVRPDITVVRTLLDHGASPSLQNARGRTALDIAARSGWEEAAALLRARLRAEE